MSVLSCPSTIKQFTANVILLASILSNAVGLAVSQKTDAQSVDFYQHLATTCNDTKFDFSGSDRPSGIYGNIRTFTVGAVSVKASAFSRTNNNGTWETAYLGLFSGGLGVTNRGEGDGGNDSHKVDNIGDRKDYVLLEFNQPVVVDKAYLDIIGADSDITVWVGTTSDPYNNHVTLNDTVLSGFGAAEENLASNNQPRWADINSSESVGNIVVVAASTSDSNPEDAFKIHELVTKCPPGPCGLTEVTTTGNSASSGSFGNIRTFNSGPINVKASAFSRRTSDGLWETAYLGAFSPGLGVTNREEGDGSNNTHKVDNIGNRRDYILFEFDQDVVVDEAYLNAIGNDSDISVWIGSSIDPYNNHLTLSDSLLNSLEASEENATTSSGARWADINAANKAGNILVIAASALDTTPDDEFKVNKLAVSCATTHRARVTIIKEVVTSDGSNTAFTNFGFTASNFGVPTFTLTDQNVIGPDRRTNANITSFGAANMITVTEDLTAGWSLSDPPTCVETGGIQNTVSDQALRQVRIIAEPGETITCTFVNTQLGVTAAHVTISGRVLTADGRPVIGANLTITNASTGEVRTARSNSFGYYMFSDVEVGYLYFVDISHKRYLFNGASRWFTLLDEMSGLDFTAEP